MNIRKLHQYTCQSTSRFHQAMARQLFKILLVLAATCFLAASSYSFKRHYTSSDRWDHIVFTQLWPGSECYYSSGFDSRSHSENSVHNFRHHCQVPDDVKVWTVHGLWPSQGTSRRGPFYCNNSWPFSDDPIQPIMSDLKLKWPNYFTDESFDSLWKHEWTKHGTCAANLPALRGESNYFGKGIELVDKYNMFQVLKKSGISPDDDNTINGDDVTKAVRNELGVSPNLVCISNGDSSYLDQIEICLDKQFNLVDCPSDGSNGCDDGITYPTIKRNEERKWKSS